MQELEIVQGIEINGKRLIIRGATQVALQKLYLVNVPDAAPVVADKQTYRVGDKAFVVLAVAWMFGNDYKAFIRGYGLDGKEYLIDCAMIDRMVDARLGDKELHDNFIRYGELGKELVSLEAQFKLSGYKIFIGRLALTRYHRALLLKDIADGVDRHGGIAKYVKGLYME